MTAAASSLPSRRAVIGCLAGLPVAAAATGWMPYPDSQVTVIQPRLSHAHARPASVSRVRIEPVITDFRAPAPLREALARPRTQALPPLGDAPPRAYVRVGRSASVDPWLLFGVALQESQLKFGARTLPYPWTLCVRGRGLRYADYEHTLRALKSYVERGVTNVDCGAMQVNWYWHSDRLGSFERALDPYPNLMTGAHILRGHYDRQGDWRQAVALYHTGAWDTAAKRARGNRYASQTLARLERLGIAASRFTGEPRHG